MKIVHRNIEFLELIFPNFILWMGLALAIRIFVMMFFVHGDLIFIAYFPTKLLNSGVLDIYRYIEINFPEGRIWTYYPPLAYYAVAIFQKILGLEHQGFHQWVENVFMVGVNNWMRVNTLSFAFYKYLLLMKLQYLFFDISSLFCIFLLAQGCEMRRRIMRLWVFSPVLLYGVYVFGQIDIIPTFLMLLSLVLIKKNKRGYAFFLLGVAVLFKTFTLFLFLPFLIALSETRNDFMKNAVLFSVPVACVLIPLWISSGGSVLYSMFPRGYVREMSFGFWFSLQKIIFIFFYLLMLFSCIKKRINGEDIIIPELAVAVLMLVYCMYFIPVQYFVWVTPIMFIELCRGKIPGWLFWCQIISLFIYNLNGPSTTSWLLAPINPDFFLNIPGLPDIMHLFSIRWGGVMLLSRLFFTIICVFIAMDFLGYSSWLMNRSVAGNWGKWNRDHNQKLS